MSDKRNSGFDKGFNEETILNLDRFYSYSSLFLCKGSTFLYGIIDRFEMIPKPPPQKYTFVLQHLIVKSPLSNKLTIIGCKIIDSF